MSMDLPRSQTASSNTTTKKTVDWWKIAALVILVLAVVSRLYALGDRAVSHDETTHAKYSWNFYNGQGFRHDPLMHGPLLFEVTAFFYALFGVSDFTARLYTALAGIALVMTPLLLRKWLGRFGALAASVLLLISPAISYYSRYTRHDIPLLLYTTLLLWTILRYLDEGKPKWLYWMAVFFPLLYATKENAYIYTLIFIALLALPLLWHLFRVKWARPRLLAVFLMICVVLLLLGGTVGLAFRSADVTIYTEEDSERADEVHVSLPWWGRVAMGLVFVAGLAALLILYYGVGEETMRALRLFDVLMTLGTLTLPLGSAFFVNYVVGADMKLVSDALKAANLSTLSPGTTVGIVVSLVAMLGLSIGLGLWWNYKLWPYIALVHYAVFFVCFSSIFTYGWGVMTGFLGGLSYWMAQQDVQRGTQPPYYYAMIGTLYEYLPLLLSIPAGILAILHAIKPLFRRPQPEEDVFSEDVFTEDEDVLGAPQPIELRYEHLLPLFFLFWAILSWGAYIVAGEKMPWLFTHIAFPHILLVAWALDRWLGDLTWEDLFARHGWVLLAAVFFLWMALAAYGKSSGTLRDTIFPNGNEGVKLTVAQLQPLGSALGAIGGVFLFGGLSLWAVDRLRFRRTWKLVVATFTLILVGYTLRTMVMANYINDELPVEYMVYAHATPDVKEALGQIEALSWRLTGTPHDIKVAFDWDVAWPFMWYMHTQYPNRYDFSANPEAQQLFDCPALLIGKDHWDEVDQAVADDYIVFDYKYIWWPVEDYKDMTRERFETAFFDPEWRAALLDIFFDRDYTQYARLRNPEAPFTLKTWPHRSEFRLYLKRDLAQDAWQYRVGESLASQSPASQEVPDPYTLMERRLPQLLGIEMPGAIFRDVAVASDGSLYVTDVAQNCVWHFSSEGDVLQRWGSYGTLPDQFNQPNGVALDSEGNVYVADTWNHRVQKFDAQGQPLLRWGRYAQVHARDFSEQGAFFAPRGVAVGAGDLIYVSDTGNHRVQVFDSEGYFLGEFGGEGADLSLMGEPLGLAVTAEDFIAVADTYNQRIQTFNAAGAFLRQWDVPVWGNTTTAELHPFLATTNGRVFASDPLHGRVLAFSEEGELAWALRDADVLYAPQGLAASDTMLYIVDPQAGQVLGYQLVGD